MRKDYKKEFMKCLESIEYGRNNYDVFQDFLTLATLSFHNVIARDKNIEKEYLDVSGRYKNNKKFAELLAITTLALEEKHQDFLGEIFMSAGFGNIRGGQFFTPYHLSKMMSKITISDNFKEQIEKDGYVTLSESCCGAGGMIIAASDVMIQKGFNPQTQMKFIGIDIDLKCCQMAYIQTSLLGLRGEVLHGNTISLEIWKRFVTPMSIIPLIA
jgi:type I restriction-modification system DNA methylase subunit